MDAFNVHTFIRELREAREKRRDVRQKIRDPKSGSPGIVSGVGAAIDLLTEERLTGEIALLTDIISAADAATEEG